MNGKLRMGSGAALLFYLLHIMYVQHLVHPGTLRSDHISKQKNLRSFLYPHHPITNQVLRQSYFYFLETSITTTIKLFLRRSAHLPVFYSAQQSITISPVWQTKWECNVQNNRAYQYEMICLIKTQNLNKYPYAY